MQGWKTLLSQCLPALHTNRLVLDEWMDRCILWFSPSCFWELKAPFVYTNSHLCDPRLILYNSYTRHCSCGHIETYLSLDEKSWHYSFVSIHQPLAHPYVWQAIISISRSAHNLVDFKWVRLHCESNLCWSAWWIWLLMCTQLSFPTSWIFLG